MPVPALSMAEAKRGNRAAWAALYEESYARLLAYSRLRLQDESLARAAVAATMRRAVREVSLFHGEDKFAVAWLVSLCRRTLLERDGNARFGVRATAADRPGPASLFDALARLRSDQREAIELCMVAGVSEAEAAMILHSTSDAVAKAKAEAIEGLRSSIEVAQHA